MESPLCLVVLSPRLLSRQKVTLHVHVAYIFFLIPPRHLPRLTDLKVILSFCSRYIVLRHHATKVRSYFG